jgi:hypothetical protein
MLARVAGSMAYWPDQKDAGSWLRLRSAVTLWGELALLVAKV